MSKKRTFLTVAGIILVVTVLMVGSLWLLGCPRELEPSQLNGQGDGLAGMLIRAQGFD